MARQSQTAIACTLMRGGTSKGPFFLASDLPGDAQVRNRVLLAAMGSPDPRQIDGVGGADPARILSPVKRPSSVALRGPVSMSIIFLRRFPSTAPSWM